MELNPGRGKVAEETTGSRIINELLLGIVVLSVVLGILHVTGIRRMAEIETLTSKVGLPFLKFARDSYRLLKRCTKPTRKEYTRICIATGIGFAIMGFIGFMVKLIHIPINNILVS